MVKGPPMHRREIQFEVLAGPGVVGRFGDVLVWLEEGEEPSLPVVNDLLAVARSVAEGEEAGLAGERLAAVLRREPLAVPAMVLVAPADGGLHAIVHGWGRVFAGEDEIDGGWEDRRLDWVPWFAAGRGGDVLRPPAPGAVHDLRRGTTPGGGAAVSLGEAVREATPAAPPAEPEPEAPAVTGARPGPPAEPKPAGPATVKGVVCGQGHFNNPKAEACETCGTSLSEGTRILTDGIRPPLGSLVLDDGTAFDLDTSHVIGSSPEDDALVAGGDADPIVIEDPSGQVAPVHAEVRLVGWEVVLVPRAETFVLTADTGRWAPARPDEPTPLPDGARVAVGSRTFAIHADPGGGGG